MITNATQQQALNKMYDHKKAKDHTGILSIKINRFLIRKRLLCVHRDCCRLRKKKIN